LPKLLTRLIEPRITSTTALLRFVIMTSVACTLIAVGFDVINQLVFFESWPASFRSWAITAAITLSITVPVSFAVGRAHLQLYRSKAEVEILSRTDELTGLLNRRALMQEAAAESPDTMVLVIADIDRFKTVNDSYGHLAGDAVIRTVSDLAHQELGDLGHLGRIGGEEFALLSGSVSPALLMLRLEKLKTRIALTPTLSGDDPIHVTISAGVAARDPAQSFDELYAAADRALYDAKTTGRNRIVCSQRFAEAQANEDPAHAPPMRPAETARRA